MKHTKGATRASPKVPSVKTASKATGKTTKGAPGAPRAAAAVVVDDAFDVDDLFKGAKARSTKRAAKAVKTETAPTIRVLLPGQKKPKQKRTTAEFTPADKPRRFEDGLPVYKSYGDFSDMKAGQVVDDNGGACPFDCNCCF